MTRKLKGIGVSPGIAVGPAFVWDLSHAHVPHYRVAENEVATEIDRVKEATRDALERIREVKKHLGSSSSPHLAVFEAYELMFQDAYLFEEVERLIRDEYKNAAWAVQSATDTIRGMLRSAADPYLSERQDDIAFVGEKLIRSLQAHDSTSLAEHVPKGAVLVAHDLSPIDTASLVDHDLAALVTEVGGKTSHTAIVARSLEMPAVVGVHGIVDAIDDGTQLIVHGSAGYILAEPTQDETATHVSRKKAQEDARRHKEQIGAVSTRDGHAVSLGGNIELPQEVKLLRARGVSTIGLYRTEFMFALGRAPDEKGHYTTYRKILKDMDDGIVTIRTFDLGGDKLPSSLAGAPEANPALGLRAIRFTLEHREIFHPQIAGILRAAVRGSVRLLLPMISSVEELLEAKREIERVADALDKRKVKYAVPKIGVMMEVPSAVFIARELARHCDFFSVGTNDLVQYLLACDRTNERVDYIYQPLHPAVLRALAAIRDAALAENIPVSICGEVAGEPEGVAVLLGMGFRELSMNMGSLRRVAHFISQISLSECEDLAASIQRAESHDHITALTTDFVQTHGAPQVSGSAA